MASAILFGFVGANVFAWMCAFTISAAPSGAAAMVDCDMEMPDAEGKGVRASYDCCLSCIAEAGLLDTSAFELPPAVPTPDSFDASVRDFAPPEPSPPSERVVPPAASPPVFLLTRSLLI